VVCQCRCAGSHGILELGEEHEDGGRLLLLRSWFRLLQV
jgi:hypothetical protein